MGITTSKIYEVSLAERSLAVALVRKYRHAPNNRELVHKHYSDALTIVQRHSSTMSQHQIVKLFESFAHILNYPSNNFINAANDLWRGNVDVELCAIRRYPF